MTTIERPLQLEGLLAKVEDIRPVIKRNRDWNEQNRRLSDECTTQCSGRDCSAVVCRAPTAATAQPDAMVTFFPKSDVQIIENWDTLGMRGTGSHDLSVTDVFVPGHRAGLVVPLTSAPPAFAGPLYRLFPWTGVHGETIPAIASAEAAVEALIELSQNKVPAYFTNRLAERELIQHHIGRTKSLVGATRAYLDRSISDAYDSVVLNGQMTTHDKKECQLAGCFAAGAAAQAIGLVHEAVGTSAFASSSHSSATSVMYTRSPSTSPNRLGATPPSE